MRRAYLNAGVIERRPDVTADALEAGPNITLDRTIATSRRRFLQSIGAVAGLLAYGQARALQALNVGLRDTTGVILSFAGDAIWSLDTSWLAGHPRVKARKREDIIEITLSGARYPGTRLSADFRAKIGAGINTPVMQIEHSLAEAGAEVALGDWLNGTTPLTFIGRGTPFSASVGKFLQVRQVAQAHVSLTPALALQAVGANAWVVEGDEFSGAADGFILARASSIELIDADSPLQRAHIAVALPDSGVRMSPLSSASSTHALQLSESLLSSLQMEAAEAADGALHHAFLSQGTGAALVSAPPEPGVTFPSARVLARNPRYARIVASDGESHAIWIAAQEQGMTGFGQHLLVTAPVTPDRRLKIDERDGRCTIECDSYPQSLALSSDAEVSITLQFPVAGAEARDPAFALPSICPFTFRHKELSLEGAQITFKRPANALLLRFRLHGFKLSRTWRGIRCVFRTNVTVDSGRT